MSSSCFACLGKQEQKLVSAGRVGGYAVAKASCASPVPIKGAAPEPSLARQERRLADEVLRRQKAEAKSVALERQLDQVRESVQEVERRLLEAATSEVAPSGSPSLHVLRSRLLDLNAQLDEERAKSCRLEAELAGRSGELDAQCSKRELKSTRADSPRSRTKDLSEKIAKDREICDLQDQLAQELSKRTELQLRMEALRGTTSPAQRQRSDSSAATTATEDRRWQTPTKALPLTSSVACPRPPSEHASSNANNPTPCFGGGLGQRPISPAPHVVPRATPPRVTAPQPPEAWRAARSPSASVVASGFVVARSGATQPVSCVVTPPAKSAAARGEAQFLRWPEVALSAGSSAEACPP